MGTTQTSNRSYWIDSTLPTSYGALEHETAADVVVVGAGITGLTTAYLLAREGLSVVVIEAGRLCAGATGYTTGKVTSQHHLIYASLIKKHGRERARAYADAQQAAIGTIADIVEAEQISCDVSRAPAYVYTEASDRVPHIERELEAAKSLGLPASFAEGDIGLPWLVQGALRFDEQMLFHPRKYCLGLADAIVRNGGRIFEHTRAVDVSESGGTCTVTTEHSVVTADAAVLATQIPFPFKGMYWARSEAVRSYAIAAPWDAPPSGMYISAEQPTRSVRPHFSDEGDVLIIGGGGHPTGREADTEGEYEALESFARERYGLEPAWRWSAQDLKPGDGLPFIGPVSPGSPRTFVATGFQKWGMTNGTVAGLLLRDAIVGRENVWRDAFDTVRLDVIRSPRTIVTQSVETMRSIVLDRVAALAAKHVEALEPGTGSVVRAEGRAVAAFRDEDGTVSAVSARCTHMGCIVHFNAAERTWDCPCHGSRFGLDGRVLDGPATSDLEQIPIEHPVDRPT